MITVPLFFLITSNSFYDVFFSVASAHNHSTQKWNSILTQLGLLYLAQRVSFLSALGHRSLGWVVTFPRLHHQPHQDHHTGLADLVSIWWGGSIVSQNTCPRARQGSPVTARRWRAKEFLHSQCHRWQTLFCLGSIDFIHVAVSFSLHTFHTPPALVLCPRATNRKHFDALLVLCLSVVKNLSVCCCCFLPFFWYLKKQQQPPPFAKTKNVRRCLVCTYHSMRTGALA